MLEHFNELNHEFFMYEALKEADKAGKRNDKPIGAVIVHNGEIIARGSNQITTSKDSIAHAEIDALHNNSGYLQEHARECVLYTTVEPCIMCISALIMANIRNVVFAVEDKYMGTDKMIKNLPYIDERLHNYLGGIRAEESANLIKTYSSFDAEVILEGYRP